LQARNEGCQAYGSEIRRMKEQSKARLVFDDDSLIMMSMMERGSCKDPNDIEASS